ncbi:hypothetical protein F4780DRAFT_222047 [Xylariomycetidae sp. FL0641]|nr:hypothetical protein F4780DRAFT_222047 [Xylariomycetidae sp. FL0641]
MPAASRLAPIWLFAATVLGAAHPMITPAPSIDNAVVRRDFSPGSYIDSVVSSFGSGVSSYIADGVAQFFQDFPIGTAVEKALDISSSDLAASPTQVLNIPAYANWTDEGWNVRVHGNVYKQPSISREKLDDLANDFLIGTDLSDLPESQQDQARNLTSEIYVVQQPDVNVTITFVHDVDIRPDASGGVINAKGGDQWHTLPYKTTPEGDFGTFLLLQNTSSTNGSYLMAGNATQSIQALNMYANGTDTGNATAYLVPPTGFTIVSDIDDILRVTKIYEPTEGLLNSFARPFTAWQDMPDIYANWSSSISDLHFHYLTTTPEQVTRNYMDFIFKTYPLGSFDTRPLNFSDLDATLAIRKHLLEMVFETFPQRKFVLMADTSNSDVMKDYPLMAKQYPDQVQCIFLRNTTATDDGDLFPYDTSGFEGIDQNKYMFFVNADDLRGVDIVGGHCHNEAVVQNVTFAYQGPGLDNSAHLNMGLSWITLAAPLLVALLQGAL